MGGSEATIGWDVSGYYIYLPALFIYKDLKLLSFQDQILKDYQPTPERQQSFPHDSGAFVAKYSSGQALQMLPFFAVAHAYATLSPRYPADGYSAPYQLGIALGALVFALVGLIFLRKYLLLYFSDHVVGLSLLLLCLGSNYFDYAGITGAMTHNTLFTLYALLLLVSHRFHQKPRYLLAVIIGGVVGLMALTRPTEIIAVIIPLVYGMNPFSKKQLTLRSLFLWQNRGKILLSATMCLLVGSIQLIYWKYVSGEWIVYSYEEQGFSWLSPHLYEGFIGYRSGWLTYSPIMICSIIGLPMLYRFHKSQLMFVLPFALLFTYITFAWDIWWYGGSLGQMAMVQLYPVLSIPFALFVRELITWKKYLQWIVGFILALFIYLNLWYTYQAHGGHMLLAGQMTQRYFWKTIGTWNYNPNDLKLLDNKDLYTGLLDEKEVQELELLTIDKINDGCLSEDLIHLSEGCQYSPFYKYGSPPKDKKWIRFSAEITIDDKEWNYWQMSQMILQYHDTTGKEVKSNMIRLQRFLYENQTQEVYLDSKIPEGEELQITVSFWNASSKKSTRIQNIKVTAH